jgi:hypothetical protein
VLRGEPGHRDIEVAPAQRGQQQQNRGVRTEPDVHIGQPQRPHLDPRNQYEEDHDQHRKVREREGKILELAQIHSR